MNFNLPFEVLIHERAKKKLEKTDDLLKSRMKQAFKLLSEPFSLDTIKIKGEEHSYRTRMGKYRILFFIEGKTVHIVDFDTRGKIYK